MDRNPGARQMIPAHVRSLSARRAWIEIQAIVIAIIQKASLSARRAWIEIVTSSTNQVDTSMSLSARRAWIEINRTR